MKKYALYLPQFHPIPENDEWWGKNFTEWVNVKKASKLYEGHLQPKVPLHNKYYSLTDVNTLKWQSELAKKYCVDGMIFYHYYFCGKKLLEKPAEILLNHKEVPMNYFFCWANHSWFRSWEGSKKLLLEQTYGNRTEWKKHFEYLLPFFKDFRYEKKNNRPIIMIFKSDFEQKREMFDFFNEKCIENGFDGIFVIETFENYNNSLIELEKQKSFQGNIFIREPASALLGYLHKHPLFRIYNKFRKSLRDNNVLKYVEKYTGDMIYNQMLEANLNDKSLYRGLFFEWDNTPRHSYRGYVITPPSKSSFMKYMDSIKDSEYVFINAWNEWCEGMMLEPTEENGYKYLEWIKEWTEKNEK